MTSLSSQYSLCCAFAVRRREKEREEVEARRALPEALRLKEDTERAKASRQNKQKGNQGKHPLYVIHPALSPY